MLLSKATTVYRIIVLFLILAAGLAGAEHRGIVKAKGLPIPGATITIIQGDRKATTSTDEAGAYAFSDLVGGAWTVRVEMIGFAKAEQQVNLTSGAVSFEWDLKLLKSADSEPAVVKTVRTSKTAAPAQAASSAFQKLGLTPTAEGEALAAAQPAETPAVAPQAPDSPRAPDASQDANESFLVNGSLGRGLAPPKQDDPFSAPRNPAAAAMIGNRTGKGMNSIQGGAFVTLRNAALDARPYSINGQNVPKPSYANSYFGILAGGPLIIPHIVKSEQTFFFVSYIGNRGSNPFDAATTLPQPAQRAGDFSQSGVTVYDLFGSRLPFPNNRIPASRFSPIAAGLLSFFPLPNQPGFIQNYQYRSSVASNNDNFGLRVGRNFAKRDRIYSTFNLQSRNSQSAQLFGFVDKNDGLGYNGDITWMHTLKSGPINYIRFSFSRNRTHVEPFFAYGQNVAANLGIPGTAASPIDYGPPNLSFTNFGGLTDASPMLRRDQATAIGDTISRMKGRHTVSLGGEYRRLQTNLLTDQNARGTLSFSGLLTSGFDTQGLPINGTGFDFADYLLGLPETSSIRFGASDSYFRTTFYTVFSQDDFRVRKNLTVIFGLRYECLSPITEKYNRMANLDIAPDFTGAAVVIPGGSGPYSGRFPRGLEDPDRNNFAPRLGVSWKPLPKRSLQLRAGYGWYYNSNVYATAAGRMAQQPPFATSVTRNTSLAGILTMQNAFVTIPAALASQYITNTYAVDRSYRVGYAQTWNAVVQQNLPGSVALELGYLGTKGTRLDMQRLPNRAAPGSPLTAEERRQIANVAGFLYESSEGDSIFHAAQVRATRRFSKGVSANALYTYGKSIDNASTFGGGVTVVAQNDQDLRAERGLSSFDKRHTLSLFYILTSPAGDATTNIAMNGWRGRLLKDWSLSGGVTANSGSPFTATVMGNRADVNGTGLVTGGSRADATGAPVELGGGFFNTAAFTIPAPGSFGNAGRNTIPGPGLFAMSMSLGRSFKLNESTRRVEFRVSATNLLNNVSITGIGATVNALNYTLPTVAAPMRTVTALLRVRF